MKNVIVRSLSGIIYIALIVGAILGGWAWFYALIALFAALATFEFSNISSHLSGRIETSPDLFPYSVVLDALAAMALSAWPCAFAANHPPYLPEICFIIALFYFPARIIMGLYETKGGDMRQRMQSIALPMFGVLYVGLPLCMLNSIYVISPIGPWMALSLFALIWLNDTGAYCFGCTLGKRRLWEELSPKKSWEGFWGGFACCVACAIAIRYCFSFADGMSVWQWAIFGVLVSAFATWGDLFESLLKRAAGVKDSSHMIPGHGGILDRIDSLLLVAPAIFIFLLITL